jgi:hypothetical protein
MTTTAHRSPARPEPREAGDRLSVPHPHQVLVVVPTPSDGGSIDGALVRACTAYPGADVLVFEDHRRTGSGVAAEGLTDHLGEITVMEQPDDPASPWQIGSGYAADHGYDIVVELHAAHSVIQPATSSRSRNR